MLFTHHDVTRYIFVTRVLYLTYTMSQTDEGKNKAYPKTMRGRRALTLLSGTLLISRNKAHREKQQHKSQWEANSTKNTLNSG